MAVLPSRGPGPCPRKCSVTFPSLVGSQTDIGVVSAVFHSWSPRASSWCGKSVRLQPRRRRCLYRRACRRCGSRANEPHIRVPLASNVPSPRAGKFALGPVRGPYPHHPRRCRSAGNVLSANLAVPVLGPHSLSDFRFLQDFCVARDPVSTLPLPCGVAVCPGGQR